MTHHTRTVLITFLLLAAGSAQANRLHSLYSISLGRADRLILELDHRAEYRMTMPADNVIDITLDGVELSPAFAPSSVPPHLSLVEDITARVNEEGRLVVRVQLRRDAEPSGTTLTAEPWRYAIDFAPRAAAAAPPKPEYVPGDRPIRTKYAYEPPLEAVPDTGLRVARGTFFFLLLLFFGAGALSVFATGWGVKLLGRHFQRTLKKAAAPESPRELLQIELERDLARLKHTVEWENNSLTEGMRQVNDAREALILQLVRDGRPLDEISAALTMTPDQIRQRLERYP